MIYFKSSLFITFLESIHIVYIYLFLTKKTASQDNKIKFVIFYNLCKVKPVLKDLLIFHQLVSKGPPHLPTTRGLPSIKDYPYLLSFNGLKV